MKKRISKPKRKPYAGILADETLWPLGRTPISKVKDEFPIVGKMVALLDHYGIPGGLDDPDTGWLLAFMLAHDHVPGFAPTQPPPPTPPPKPPHRPPNLAVGFRDVIIYAELSRAKREGRPVSQAARELSERWRKEGKCDWQGIALEKKYYKIRKSGVPTKGMLMAGRKVEMSRSTSKS